MKIKLIFSFAFLFFCYCLVAVEKFGIKPEKIKASKSVNKIVGNYSDKVNHTIISTSNPELELAKQLKIYEKKTSALVDLGPEIVAGEGSHPENHSVVRILNKYGICEVQFLAFPPSVKGGVNVNTGFIFGKEKSIVVNPISAKKVSEIKIFNKHSGLINSFKPSENLTPPYVLTVGNFSNQNSGDEIAIAGKTQSSSKILIFIYNGVGKKLSSFKIDKKSSVPETISLSTKNQQAKDLIILYQQNEKIVSLLDVQTGKTISKQKFDFLEKESSVYESAFDEKYLTACGTEPDFSSVVDIDLKFKNKKINVGTKENIFWYTFGGIPSPYDTTFSNTLTNGKYVKKGIFEHIRTDSQGLACTKDDLIVNENIGKNKTFKNFVNNITQTYNSAIPRIWEPTFSHRWDAGFKKIENVIDKKTGLSKFLLLDRFNKPVKYVELDVSYFILGSYATKSTVLKNMYTYPLRAFLKELAVNFRKNPEHFIAVEPTHEAEISSTHENNNSRGDYNITFLEGFYEYLIQLYGNLENINQEFGTPFNKTFFDAPRDFSRGKWDSYDLSNPYYMTWMKYNNHVIYTMIASTYREALLAGFPPEAITCHQIPDSYAFGSLTAFSKPAIRITPIDWNLNAGTGYGFTRYGLWYNAKHNVLQGANSSGFDMMTIGEYHALVPDANETYKQLKYLQNNGVNSIHCMWWPASHDKGYNVAFRKALECLISNDSPRTNLTGGTGQIRAVRSDKKKFDIVSIGTQSRNTGLLKSINKNGTWEGSVYVVPFHSHVEITPIVENKSFQLKTEEIRLGNFKELDSGQQIEVSFFAKSKSKNAAVSLKVFHKGIEIPDQCIIIPINFFGKHYRYIFRAQTNLKDISFKISSGEFDKINWKNQKISLKNLNVILHSEKTAKIKRGIFEGKRHKGGIMFDVL